MANDPIPGLDNPHPGIEGLTPESLLEEAQKLQVIQEDGSVSKTLTPEEQATKDASEQAAREAADAADASEGGQAHEGETEEEKSAREDAEKAARDAEEAEAAAKKAAEAEDPGSKIKIPGADEPKKDEKKDQGAKSKDRDKDLDALASRVDKTNNPRVRKVVENLRSEVSTARDRAETAASELATLRAELEALKAKPAELPKETQEQLTQLRERVRELDITRDPEFESRFDKKITTNESAIVEILKSGGADKRAVYAYDEKGQLMRDRAGKPVVESYEDDPANLQRIIKGGLNIETMGPMIKSLEAAGKFGEAEKLRSLVVKNGELSEERTTELAKWKETYDAKRAAGFQTNDEARKKQITEIQTAVRTRVNEEFSRWGFKPPAPIQQDDSAEVKAVKQKKLDEFNRTVTEFTQSYQQTIGNPVKAGSELAASLFVKNHVLPKIVAEKDDLTKRVAELEAQIKSFRAAGNMSRLHAKISPDAKVTSTNKNAELDIEHLERTAKELGIPTGN